YNSINDFKQKNRWVSEYYPAFKNKTTDITDIKKGWFRSFTEKIFSGRLGDATDNWLMRLTAKRWKKKEHKHLVNAKGICMSMLASKHYSKPDPRHFQLKVLQQFDNKIDQILEAQPAIRAIG
ncbi:MAG: hypothetical protein ABUT20_54680, partial [Bacteroidota bacterium]